MARKKRKSAKRGRGGRFVKRSKARRSRSRKRRSSTRRVKRVTLHFNPAKGKKKKHHKKGKKRGRGGKRKSSKKKKGYKAKRVGTKRLMKMLRKRGYAVKPRGGKKGKTRKQKRKTGTRTRVARHMAAANKHRTYPVMNPSRRRRKRRNPSRRRHYRRNPSRRYRRNPGLGGIMQLAKRALPVMAGMIVGRLVAKQITERVSAVSKLGQFTGPGLAIGMLFLGNIATNKIAPLRKHKDAVMLGLGINVVTELLSMIPQVKGFLGLGEGIYDRALSDYVTTNDYLTTGATPIDDDIALSDYVTTGGLEEELGLSEELGISEELGAIDAGTVPGGVSQLAMIKSIPNQSFMEEVPARSFSKEVSHAGQGYDNPGALYAGIFRGGF